MKPTKAKAQPRARRTPPTRKAPRRLQAKSKPPKPAAKKRKASQPQGQYEAGQRWSTRRSYVPGHVRDARFDADSATRLEIVRKSRYFERNNAILNRLCDLFEQYSVGANGLQFIPASDDQEWNQRATDWFSEWQEVCELSSLQNFGTCQSLAARGWMVDGEMFVLKTHGRQREEDRRFPRIQMVESHRVSTPGKMYGSDSIVDGIRIDSRGRPKSYFVGHGTLGDEEFTEVPAEEMVHIFEPSRVSMYRGLPFAYPVLNDLHDLDDLQLLEMDAAKEAAKTTNVIKTRTGELNAAELRRSRFTIGGKKGTSGGSSQDRDQFYEEVFEGGAKVLRHGDEMQQFVSSRPGVAQQQYWDYLASKVCAGVGISKLLVFPWSMQGTVTRADLDVANAFFRSRSAVLSSKFMSVYLFVMGWAVRNVRDLSDPPLSWKRVTVRPPRSVNVDVGRNAAALIAEYQAGWRTLESICGELGEDWRKVLRQRGIERAAAREIEVEFKLQPGELIEAALEAITKQAQQQLPAPQEQSA